MRIAVLLSALVLVSACDKPAADLQPTNADAANTTTNATVGATLPPPLANKADALKLMHDRHEDMEKIGKAVKAARRALDADPADMATVQQSAATIATFAPQVPSWFPQGTGPDAGKTMAKPAIWEKPADFVAKAEDFEAAALAFDAAAKSGDAAAAKAAFGDLGKTCKACHDPYRTEHEKH